MMTTHNTQNGNGLAMQKAQYGKYIWHLMVLLNVNIDLIKIILNVLYQCPNMRKGQTHEF